MGPDAVCRSRCGNRARWAKILRRARGCAIASFEFPDEGTGQMASSPPLVGGRRADSLIDRNSLMLWNAISHRESGHSRGFFTMLLVRSRDKHPRERQE